MDALSAALDDFRITAVRVESDAMPEARVRHPRAAAFVLMTGGRSWLTVDRQAGGYLLQPGDFVLLLSGRRYTVTTTVGVAFTADGDLQENAWRAHPHRGGGENTIITGAFQLSTRVSQRVAAVLPQVVHVVAADRLTGGWIRTTLEFAADEGRRSSAGSHALVNRLCEAVVTYAIRAHLSTMGTRGDWLKALNDPQVGGAVALIHSHPERRWTVKSLANRVGMSRSSFAAQFRAVVGETPLQHLIRSRVDKACDLLQADSVNLVEVAARVGYESDAAFSKVFKRCIGMAPGAYRARSAAQALISPARRAN